MELLGSVVRLQVQTRSLKLGERPHRWYDPAHIRAVSRLGLDPDGVTGWSAEGERLDDVHNANHPESKNRGGNGVSLGFTGHYGAMRRRFGTHMGDGIAGENLLIATGIAGGRAFGEEELVGANLVIETDSGRLRLGEVRVAEPCVEFSRFALGAEPTEDPEGAVVKDALQFLRRGLRGYYAAPSGSGTVDLGDLVYRL